MLPVANPSVIFKAMSDGAVLFDTQAEVYFGLNEVGARIWQLLPPVCQSIEEICARLATEYPEVAASTLRDDVVELLDQFVREGLATAPASTGQNAGADAARAP